jgi:hypothetical protein
LINLQSAYIFGELIQYLAASFFDFFSGMSEARKQHPGISQHKLCATHPAHGYEFHLRLDRSPVLASNHPDSAHSGPHGVQNLQHGGLRPENFEDRQG